MTKEDIKIMIILGTIDLLALFTLAAVYLLKAV
jgi:hypothetical protein